VAEGRAHSRKPVRGRDADNDRFLEGFLLPLLRGGQVQVGRPLGAPELGALAAEAVMPGEVLLEVERARRLCAAGLWLYPVTVSWDEVSARLGVAMHNLLFLGHPDAHRWTARSSRLGQVTAFTRGLLELPPPRSGAEAVARHTLVRGLFDLRREDVVVDTWLMVYSFRGQEPPPNLRRLPTLRRVREKRTEVQWVADEELTAAQRELLGRLLRASPLTDLLTLQRTVPPFAWAPVASYLRWPFLGRLVCQRYLEIGLDKVSRPLCTEFWELTTSPGGGKMVARVLGLLVYLCAAANLSAASPVPPLRPDEHPLTQLSTVLAVASECGLLPAAEAMDAALHQRLQQLAAERAKTLDPQTLNELAARLRAALE
jgi:hypothetical protein